MTPVRVAMVNLTGGGLSGGYRKYLRAVVPLLRADPLVSRLEVFAPGAAAESLRGAGLGAIETWPEDDARFGWPSLREAVHAAGSDVVFVPTARSLPALGVPQVVMVRNMEPLEQPFRGLGFGARIRNAGRAIAAWTACRRAARVIAVSRHVAGIVERRLRVPAARIVVVPHGANGPDADAAAAAPSSAAALARQEFLFTAGSLRPARGLDELVDALALLGRQAPRVLVAGGADADTAAYASRLKGRAGRLVPAGVLTFAGPLEPSGMRWAFEGCSGFVMTSRAEACPNTALEALDRGVVVLSSQRAPMPEILGDAALYYQGVPDLAAGLVRLSTLSEAERARRRSVALERAARFTWEAAARATVDVLVAAARDEAR